MTAEVRILVVEDNNVGLELIINQLSALGFTNIIDAYNGESALNQLEKAEVDLIISDWEMPGMDGLEFFKVVKENEGIKDTPFLMVTAENDKEKILDALKSGVEGYIVKPYDIETLSQKINGLLKKD